MDLSIGLLGKYPPSPWRVAAKFATKRRVYGRVCVKTPADVQVPGTGRSHPGQPKDQVKGKMACLTGISIYSIGLFIGGQVRRLT